MKQTFVESLKPGTDTTDFFMVHEAQLRDSKTGSQFLALTLGDRTGKIDAKFWQYTEKYVPAAGDVVKLKGRVEEYKGKPQLKLERIRLAIEEEFSAADYLPASTRDRDGMLDRVCGLTDDFCDPNVAATVRSIVQSCAKLLRDAPAARGMHQAYLGGLLEHIINLANLADIVCENYPDLDRDVMIAACIVHDIGKVYELTYDKAIGNTLRGRLVGHVVIGLQMFAEHRVDRSTLTNTKLNHLEHIIASHHGKLEWGSPVLPMTREAIVFHQLDMIDSRMAGLENAEKDKSRDADGFVRARTFDGGLAWFPPKEDSNV